MKPSRITWKTYGAVLGVHLLLIFLLLFNTAFMQPKPPQEYIELVDIGELNSNHQGNAPTPPNPTPSFQHEKQRSKPPTPPKEKQADPPQKIDPPTKKEPEKISPQKKKRKTVTQKKKKEKSPPTPTKTKKKQSPKIDVNMELVQKNHSPSTSANSSPTPTASEISQRLSNSLQSLGITNKNSGSSSGSLKASWYHSLLKRTIDNHWSRPAINQKLVTKVSLKIKPDGTLVLLGINESSGNSKMDNSVLKAIRSARKLSAPLPKGLGNPDYELILECTL